MNRYPVLYLHFANTLRPRYPMIARYIYIALSIATSAAGWSAIAVAAETRTPAPDLIYYNANVITVDDAFSYAEAVAISGDRFTAVGSNERVRELAGPHTRQVDLVGRTVMPGMADNHLHTAGGGDGVDLSRVRTMDELLAAIAARAEETPTGQLIVSNRNWHEAQLEELRLPLRRDLDKAAPNHPVVILRGGHTYLLNSKALAKWNIDASTPVPTGGHVSRYDDGTLTGELVDRAKTLVNLPAPDLSLEDRIRIQIAEYDMLHAAGVTSVRHPGATGGTIEHFRVRQEIHRRGLLTMRVRQLLSVDPRSDVDTIKATVDSWNLGPREGDSRLRVSGIKLGVDGGFEGGHMHDPYAEPWGQEGTYYGLQTVPQDRFKAAVSLLNRLGWQVYTHAVGDAAIDQVLDAYEAANRQQSIVDARWGIEHAFIPRQDQFPRMKALGLHISAQHHLYLAGPRLEQYWGRERAEWTTPVKAYLDAGIHISGGTDSDVIPYPPLWVIYHFVTRDTIAGGVFGADQAISREDAIRLVTRNYWRLSFEEDSYGTIEPGRYADLVILDDDIMSVPEGRIEELNVLLTMVGGKVVYENKRNGWR